MAITFNPQNPEFFFPVDNITGITSIEVLVVESKLNCSAHLFCQNAYWTMLAEVCNTELGSDW